MEDKKINEINYSNLENNEIKNLIDDNEKSSSEHHHHHHHHHSKKKRSNNSNRNKKNKLKAFYKKNKKKIFKISGIVAIVLVLVVIGIWSDVRLSEKETSPVDKITKNTNNSINIEYPFFTEDVVIVNDAVYEYTQSDNIESIKDVYNKYSNNKRLDYDVPVKLSYNVTDLPSNIQITSSNFKLADNKDFKNARTYNVKANSNSVEINGLFTNTTYYYNCTVEFSNGFVSTGEGSFKTADTPRVIFVDGVVNFRDFGGYMSSYGSEIKQGLLYRGSELDGAVKPKYTISSDGIAYFLTELNIKTEMDLRNEAEVNGISSPLGSGVEYKIYNAAMYVDTFSAAGKNTIKNIFTDFAKESNYPMYMHCTYGLDRTGTVSYLLGAVLGVSEEDLMRDYKLSYLYHGWTNDSDMDDFIKKLKRYEGDNIKEKSENFLYSTGVTKKEIEKIRDIFLVE